jgi:PknH-like protein
MRSPASKVAVVGACVALAGCAAPVDGTPVVHIVEAAKPSPSRPLNQILPTADELTSALGAAGFMGQQVEGGPDMLLAGVGVSEATPVECVSATYRLQKVVYQSSPVRAVASESWAGGDANGPTTSGFFGAVKFATPDDAQAFFAASAEKWQRCNGQTLVIHQPQHGADGASRITDVEIDAHVVSAVVMQESGGAASPPLQRALGLASDCIVDVEVTDTGGTADAGGAHDAVGVANLMLNKVGVS